jgi:hypothetical protein
MIRKWQRTEKFGRAHYTSGPFTIERGPGSTTWWILSSSDPNHTIPRHDREQDSLSDAKAWVHIYVDGVAS